MYRDAVEEQRTFARLDTPEETFSLKLAGLKMEHQGAEMLGDLEERGQGPVGDHLQGQGLLAVHLVPQPWVRSA